MPDLPPPYVPGDGEETPDAPADGRPTGDAAATGTGRRGPGAGEEARPGAGEPSASVPADRRPAAGEDATVPAGGGADRRLAADVTEVIRDVPDFPRPGILFRDVTPLFADPELFRRVTRRLAREARRRGAERIAGIESRGFLLGTPVALMLDVPFVTVRKKGKLPGETRAVSYDLEYGSGHLEVQADAMAPGERVVVVDDLLATGGTAAAAAQLLEGLDGIVGGMCFLIELAGLEGRQRLGRYNTYSLLDL